MLERVADGPGILKVENGAFGAALDAMIGGWDAKLPVILSGMIGSRQGWREAPYARCPAGRGRHRAGAGEDRSCGARDCARAGPFDRE